MRTLYTQASEDTENETWKAAYADIATRFQSVANRLSDALEAHKNFVDWLAEAGADDKPPPFDAIVRQLALRDQAANATVIVVHVHDAAQGTMSEQRRRWRFSAKRGRRGRRCGLLSTADERHH